MIIAHTRILLLVAAIIFLQFVACVQGRIFKIVLVINQWNTTYNGKQAFYAVNLAIQQVNSAGLLGNNDTFAIANGGIPIDFGLSSESSSDHMCDCVRELCCPSCLS
jgi:hypothetical protein